MSEEDQEDKPHPPPLWQSAFPAAAVFVISEIPENLFGFRLSERRQQYRFRPVTPIYPSIAATVALRSKAIGFSSHLHFSGEAFFVKTLHFISLVKSFSALTEQPIPENRNEQQHFLFPRAAYQTRLT